MNLISAKNEQKAVVAMAATLPVKQQLPMKLAKLGAAAAAVGGSAGLAGTHLTGAGPAQAAHGLGSASPTSGGGGGGLVQQLLPLRLSESLEHKRSSPKVSTDAFKPKLSSSSFSPPASKSEDFVAGHNRTGSSPASIQMLSPRHLHFGAGQPPPKIPDKPSTLLLQQAARGSPQLPPPPPPPKVHDPETNQEIVFL